MNIKDLKNKNIPNSSGIYIFKKDAIILYIGKATNLLNRIKSYFNNNILLTRGLLIEKMIFKASDIEFIKTDSVLEALILESNLIKKYNPKYNSKEKDDKSFNYVAITKEDFPRVLIVRGKDLESNYLSKDIKYIFGPFPSGNILKEAIKIIRKIFPFRDKCVPFNEQKRTSEKRGKQCFNRQIKLCPGVCSGEIIKKEYNKIIQNIKLIFQGKKKALIKKLKLEMKILSKNKEFEKAIKIKKTIFTLEHIQDIALLKQKEFPETKSREIDRVEAYDIAHLSGTNSVGVMVVLENGEIKKSEYKKFKIKGKDKNNDIANLKEILERRFKHLEWKYPNFIVADGGKSQKNIAEYVLKKLKLHIPILSVVKDEHHKPKNILGDKKLIEKNKENILLLNNEAHRFAISYHRALRKKFLQ